MEHETTVDTLCRDTSDTSDITATTATSDTSDTSDTTSPPDAELVDELLIEEISIDGMCGVY